MLTTSASDIDASSNDHHDVKDLSFRTNPPQTPSISSTGATATNNNIHHMDTSDYDSTRSPTTSSGTTSTTSTRVTTANISHHLNNLSPPHAHENSISRNMRMRKLSETSTDVEHFNNSYKFKNYIQQRFTHENYHSEESMQSTQCATEHHDKDHHDKKSTTPSPHHQHVDTPTKLNGHHDIKSEVLISKSPSPAHQQSNSRTRLSNGVTNGNQAIISHHSIPIPIFACHTQGFYVPLNVDYEVLIPFLSGIDLLNKNYTHISPLHPISININYTPAMLKNAIASTNFIKPKVENGLINGWWKSSLNHENNRDEKRNIALLPNLYVRNV